MISEIVLPLTGEEGQISAHTEDTTNNNDQTLLSEKHFDDVTTLLDQITLEPKKEPANAGTAEALAALLDQITLEPKKEPANAPEDENKDAKSEDNYASPVEPLLNKSRPEELYHENYVTSAKLDAEQVKEEAHNNSVLNPEQQADLNENFFKAISANDIREVIDLINQGADVNGRDRYNKTALIKAAFNGHTEVAALLLEKGAEVNGQHSSGATALVCAAFNGHTEVAALLLEKGADLNAIARPLKTTALMEAARRGHTEVAALLLEKGADVDAKDNYGRTAFMYALFEWHNKVAELLLERGVDVNDVDCDGQTTLMNAAFLGYNSVVEFLLEKGADVNAEDRHGRTALVYAIYKIDIKTIRLLLDQGANVTDRIAVTSFELFNHKNAIERLSELKLSNIHNPPEDLPKAVRVIALIIAYGSHLNFKNIIKNGELIWYERQAAYYCEQLHEELYKR
ncbi:MAG: ankyrin repeat domain-containing protein [Rickettsiaceae bacterium]|nr:ankyrin repeat domain-containing protein [Rickettsiaceae bacterium]